MQAYKNLSYYLTAVVLFVLLKFGFRLADNNDLIFLLKPTDKLVGVLTGSYATYLPEVGYFNEKLNIIIDKSCSGFNFWLLAFLLFTFVSLSYFEKTLHKILTIPTALICAYILTLFVNTSRIYTSVVIQNHTKNIFRNQQLILHEAIGIVTNLTFLILAYILIEKLLKTKRHA